MISSGVRNISVERALRWLQAFSVREWSLLLPVALAFFGVPRLIVILLAPRVDRLPQTIEEMQAFSQTLPLWWTPLIFVLLLIGIVGAMALMAMAIVPWITVGQAIILAAKRLIVWLALAAMAFAALFVALLLVMTVALGFGGGGQALSIALAFVGLVANALLLTLTLPLIIHRAIGPIAAVRAAWGLYRGVFLRIAGALILFALTAWIAGLALQVSLGSLLLLVAKLAGQPRIGEVLVALLVSAVTAVGWSGVYLLVAGFYRQRTGLD